jgi:hypothetical protein
VRYTKYRRRFSIVDNGYQIHPGNFVTSCCSSSSCFSYLLLIIVVVLSLNTSEYNPRPVALPLQLDEIVEVVTMMEKGMKETTQ